MRVPAGLQGLDDHAHRPTLERIPKDKPIVASPAGAAVAKQLGFKEVHSVDHGQAITMGPLTIRATMGTHHPLFCLSDVTCAVHLHSNLNWPLQPRGALYMVS